jgi:general secretion pathway protein D
MGGYGMGMGMGMGGYGTGGYPGMGGYGMGLGTGYGAGLGGYGGGGMGSPYGQGLGYQMVPGIGYPGAALPTPYMGYAPQGMPPAQTGAGAAGTTGAAGATGAPGTTDQTGSYLGFGGLGSGRIPRVIPNPLDNTLLIHGTPQEYQQILKLLRQLDVPPRQVLIDAKIFEVNLSGAFASGVTAYFRQKTNADRSFLGQLQDGATLLSAGALVGQSKEFLAFLQLSENSTKAKVLSTPSIIATDSIPANIHVGSEVPVLSSQSVSPIQSGGDSLFANTISSRSTGVHFAILARVNPSGVVTLQVNQEVSAPQAPAQGSIQSPSFSTKSITTQVTVQDGDTIAIGGIISESSTSGSAGIPVLHKIPILGAAFGSRSYSSNRSELIIFMTPRVIYDTNHIVDASEELMSRIKKLPKDVQQ